MREVRGDRPGMASLLTVWSRLAGGDDVAILIDRSEVVRGRVRDVTQEGVLGCGRVAGPWTVDHAPHESLTRPHLRLVGSGLEPRARRDGPGRTPMVPGRVADHSIAPPGAGPHWAASGDHTHRIDMLPVITPCYLEQFY